LQIDNFKFNRIISLCLLAIAGTMISVAVFQFLFKHYLQQVDNQYFLARAERIAQSIEQMFVERGYTEIGQWHEFRRNYPEKAGRLATRENISVVDKNGIVIFHVDSSKEGTIDKAKPNFEKESVSCRFISNINRELYSINIPLKINGKAQGILRANYLQSPEDKFSYLVFYKVKKSLFLLAGFLSLMITSLIMAVTLFFSKEWVGTSKVGIKNEKQLALIGVGIAHEVKNSLNGIAMNAQLLQDSFEQLPFEEKGKYLKKIDRIQKESARTGKMLNEFLSYAKPGKFTPKPVNIFTLLGDIAKFFEPECRTRNIKLDFRCSRELTNVNADEQQLRHCISNLLWNAINAVDTEGEILLEGESHKNKVVIKITDSGGGMDSETEDRAFELFYSTRRQGAGLGLSIAQRVAKSHGGKITFENRKGEGCTFILTF